MKTKEINVMVSKKESNANFGSVGISLSQTVTLDEKDNEDLVIAIIKDKLFGECEKFILEKIKDEK